MNGRTGSDAGVTLIEVLVTMVLSTIIGSLGLLSLQAYGNQQDRQGTADEVVSVLRATAQRSLSEGRTYCVQLDPASDDWTVWRRSCSGTGTEVDGGGSARGDAELAAIGFTAPAAAGCAGSGTCVYFYPRGTATPGSLQVNWGTADNVTVTVEGLSSRVSRS